MPQGSDLRFGILAIFLAILLPLLLILSGGNFILPVAFLALIFFVVTFPRLFDWPTVRVVQIFVFIYLVLDVPSARPFYEYDPITEFLGSFLFDGLTKVIGIPGIPTTLFELVSFFLLGLCLWKHMFEKHVKRMPPLAKVVLVGCLIPAVALFGVFTGLIRGNDWRIAITQTRFFLLYPTWFLIGYLSLRRAEDLIGIFKVITAAMLIKSFQAIYVYFFILNGSLGDKEFLVDHLSSDFLATSMIFLGGYILFVEKSYLSKILTFFMVVPMAVVYFINDRRSSLVGVIIGLALLLAALPLEALYRRRKPLLLSFIGVVSFTVLTWRLSGPLGFFAMTIRSLLPGGAESAASYRAFEDYNLLRAVSENPVFGIGFGRTFPLYIKLPDVSFVYENFDLIPHNTVLYLWTFAGPVGIAGLSLFVASNIAMSTKLFNHARSVLTMLVAAVTMTMVVRWLVYAYGDIGLLEIRIVSLMSLALGGCWKFYNELNENVS